MNRNVLQVLAGATGGFASWLLALFFNLQLIPTQAKIIPSLIPVVFIFFGIISAFIGPFLANTKEDEPLRFAIFCMLCGMSWKPVLDAGQHYIKGYNQVESAITDSGDLRGDSSALKGTQSAQDASRFVDKVSGKTIALIEKNSNLPVATPPKESGEAIRDAITTLGTKGIVVSPDASIKALTDIGQKTISSKNENLFNSTVQSLETAAATTQDPNVKAKIWVAANKLKLEKMNK